MGTKEIAPRVIHIGRLGIIINTPLLCLVSVETMDGKQWNRIIWRIMWRVSK